MNINRLGKQEDSLYHDTLDLCGITNTANYPLTTFFRNANEWYKKTDNWIWDADYVWEFDDSNRTDLPIYEADIVNGQQDYELPSIARRIDMVSVLTSDGDYQRLTPLDKSQLDIDPSEFYSEDGFPMYYDMIGRSMFLYPAPSTDDVTATNGLKIYLKRGIQAFAITDTATEPGFDSNFHRIISLGCAYDKSIADSVDEISQIKVNRIKGLLDESKEELQKFYAGRMQEFTKRLIPNDRDQI